MLDNTVIKRLSTLDQDNCEFDVTAIASLWSGYGAVTRYKSKAGERSFIVKYVDLTKQEKHPRNWNSDFAHKRKINSYINEQLFYQINASHTVQTCRVPTLYFASQSSTSFYMILEDLSATGFVNEYNRGNLRIAHTAIDWLAHLHARFMGVDLSHLWERGTYWHLQTRQAEWQCMADGPLKDAASAIDSTLNQCPLQTCLHGDAKLANFCFDDFGDAAAGLDFQYAGSGCGIKDVVYFLGSCFSDAELHEHADACFTRYFSTLKSALDESTDEKPISIDTKDLHAQWSALIPFAWADFERFLLGWAPEHHKLTSYSSAQTQLALNALEGA